MATCFIFARQLDEEHCLSLRLDQNGQVDAPLLARSIQHVRELQMEARTIVVLPSESSGIYTLELPWLGERKARAAIPYALEDQLAQNVLNLHFAFDRQHYKNNCYLVAVTDKQYLLDLIAKLDKLDIDFDMITLDWFALRENEACITDHGLLINDDLFKGALQGELATLYLKQHQNTPIWIFTDSVSHPKNSAFKKVDSDSSTWIAERLLQADILDLCQDDLQRGSRQLTNKYWYTISAVIAAVLFFSTVVCNGFYVHALSTKIAGLDKKIAVIYREFFPQAEFVVSPKFRISQLLKTGFAEGGSSTLWSLLDKLARSYQQGQFTIEQFRFQNKVLSVTLISQNFAALETLQLKLKQANVKVTQAQASTKDQQVVATLELSL